MPRPKLATLPDAQARELHDLVRAARTRTGRKVNAYEVAIVMGLTPDRLSRALCSGKVPERYGSIEDFRVTVGAALAFLYGFDGKPPESLQALHAATAQA